GGTQDDVIDDAVALGFFRTHEEVTLGVALDLLDRLAGVLRQDVVERLADAEDFLGMDLDVGGLALESTRRLMDQDAGVGQGEAHSLGTASKEDGRHAGGQAHADGGDPRTNVTHRVVDRQPGGDHAARAVDVDVDVLVRVLGGEKQQLRHDDVGDLVVDGRADEDDAVLEEPGVDIEGTLTAVGGLDDHGDEGLGTPAEPFEIHGWLSCRHYRVQFLQSSLPRTHF